MSESSSLGRGRLTQLGLKSEQSISLARIDPASMVPAGVETGGGFIRYRKDSEITNYQKDAAVYGWSNKLRNSQAQPIKVGPSPYKDLVSMLP